MRIRDLDPHRLGLLPLIGSPISASTASSVYNRVFDEYGVHAVFRPIEITVEQLPAFLDAAKLLGLPGCVLTSPLKSAVVPLLDEVDPISRAFRSVNAIRFRDGVASGRGLDGAGVVGAFDSAGVELAGARVAMLGAGGVSGVFASELAQRGIAAITILNRTEEKARTIADALRELFPAVEVGIAELTAENAASSARDADILLQGTTLGSKAAGTEWPDFGFVDALPAHAWVLEAVSNPPETGLIRAAKERGLGTLLGMDMLVEQMTTMFRFLLDVELPPEAREIARDYYCDLFGYVR